MSESLRVLVCGSRDLTVAHLPLMLEWLRRVWRAGFVLIHGDGPPGARPGAIGADKLAEVCVSLLDPGGPEPLRFPADWRALGKGAGPKRNQRMHDEGRPHVWAAFHTDPGLGRGTRGMVGILQQARLHGRVVLLPWDVPECTEQCSSHVGGPCGCGAQAVYERKESLLTRAREVLR